MIFSEMFEVEIAPKNIFAVTFVSVSITSGFAGQALLFEENLSGQTSVVPAKRGDFLFESLRAHDF
jgi:hypothetical protein